jgi:hypothetical protein
MLGGDNKLKPVAVKVGITDYNRTQMTEGDLKGNNVLARGKELAQGNQSQGIFPGNQRVGGRLMWQHLYHIISYSHNTHLK